MKFNSQKQNKLYSKKRNQEEKIEDEEKSA